MKAYFFQDDGTDQRQPHNSQNPLPPSRLHDLGILHYTCPDTSSADEIATQRAYKNRDEITISPAAMGEQVYEDKVRMFFQEHLHEDEEIRWIREGAGYFDVRDCLGKGEQWVRIRVEKDDLIVLPKGIWHRFSTDEGDYIKAVRLFKDEPKWTPLNRAPELEENPHRKQYLQDRSSQAAMMT